MRITIVTSDTALTFMRRAGYGYQKEGGGEVAFVRRVSGSLFPRYHAYTIEQQSKAAAGQQGSRQLVINLHVDQKAPTYQRGRTHSGEYDGPLIEQEAERLRVLAQQADASGRGQESSGPENGQRDTRGQGGTKRKGFWGKLFG